MARPRLVFFLVLLVCGALAEEAEEEALAELLEDARVETEAEAAVDLETASDVSAPRNNVNLSYLPS